MEIVHHFGIRISGDSDRQEFVRLGIDLEAATPLPNGNIITSFEIGEHDPRWAEARRLAAKFQITEFARARFRESEIDAAETMSIFARSQHGYPEPSEKFGYLNATFDLSDYCSKCGTGLRQVRPFRVKSDPHLKRAIMQLNWIFDEFFVASQVWLAVFEPLGVGCWPVVLDRTGEEIGSVVQLKVTHYADLKLDKEGIVCSHCGRRKASLDLTGFSPSPINAPAPIFKSTQYFGSNATAFRRVLITSSLYTEIKKNSLRGIDFYPCGPESD